MTAPAEALTLFDELPPAPTQLTATARCLWHLPNEPGAQPKPTHRIVRAVDLMNPRWWQNGGLHSDGALRACDGGRVRLHVVGASICGPCTVDYPRQHTAADHRYGIVTHFVPLPDGAAS